MLYHCKADNDYDQIGQLIEDDAEFISHIEWNTQNKIKRVVRAHPDLIADPSGNVYRSDLEFVYDPLGNRVAKIEKPRDSNGDVKSQLFWIYTLYARDATGNTLATYSRSFETPQGDDPIDHLSVQAHEIYGSKRLGTSRVGVHMQRAFEINTMTTSSYHAGNQSYSTEEIFGNVTYFTSQVPAPSNQFTHVLGRKQYELSNHLGNVLATISDAKTPQGASGNGQALGYAARIVNLQDYYPFGMLQPGRQFSEEGYGYGYQGSEKDDEIKGSGNHYTTFFRQLDVRLGRWWTVDPKASSMPWQSPYLSMDGNPIWFNDHLGDKVDPSSSGYADAKHRATEFKEGRKGKLIRNNEYEPEFAKLFNEWDNNDEILVQFEKGEVHGGTKGGTIEYRGDKDDQKVYGVLWDPSQTERLGASGLFEESYHLMEALEGTELSFDKPLTGIPGLDIYDEIRAKRWVIANIRSVQTKYSLGDGYQAYTHYGYINKKLKDTEVFKRVLMNGAPEESPLPPMAGTSGSTLGGSVPANYTPSNFGGNYGNMSSEPQYPPK